MNIIVCFSWLGNNSLSEKQVLFLLQLHILGLIFRKVRHRTLRRAVTGALFLLFQCLLRCIFLDVLCTGDRDKENTRAVSRQKCDAEASMYNRKPVCTTIDVLWAEQGGGESGLFCTPLHPSPNPAPKSGASRRPESIFYKPLVCIYQV